ncbi:MULTISPECIES: ABC transporter ATP-binding protein [unclassified Bosea (in: a-proteobacteria)]|uniref:ABC transporter ATP-binding protein n=1 Tax=unclassified Bosea (in: a-proteobacteria) TaxID=2653178 RepID=UPI000954C822|nr:MULTISPECIES: ABC transporter ATP-binding protein [unclassified Bosea (in: a-proteobacteria)]TAJ33819.1 MAG: ABC transporter ATP-binding protein [Bosea sp. (in: a-proteobacteria)]SIR60136.1 putative spermidine/putrescine transport system ATP-binding protein/putrescine transport system ATP-binding protein [Bosea sp. TND4EK4]
MSIAALGKAVSIRALHKSYGATLALDDVSLDIPAGCFCTLLGASGSGKTTLLKTIAGFETYDRGRILVGGVDIGPVPVSKRNIGMVFQNYALFPHMSVRRNVAFGLEMRKLPAREVQSRVEEALALVDLIPYAERLPRQLSGGQQQRVALARALVIRPDILLMDEPLGALDKNLRQAIQVELKRLHAAVGATVVYVTHDQEEALFLSDQIAVMDKGRIVQIGSPRALYDKPVDRFVATFLGECNFVPAGTGILAVRPEKIRVGEAARGCEHMLPAKVASVDFIGRGFRLLLDRHETEITALVDSTDEIAALQPGAETIFGFRAGDVLTIASH